jgi:hypothetical protein
MPDTDPSSPSDKQHHRELEGGATEAVEDAIEFFGAEGDEDSPTSQSDAPAPG